MSAVQIRARVGAAFTGERGERLGRALLVAAMVVSAALLLWLNRETSFWNDELTWFGGLAGPNDLESILIPHNSHLIGTTRLVYLLVAELIGTDYVVLRLLGVAGVLLTAALLFVWAKRRIGPGWALLPAVLVLFYGSAWQHVVGPIGFTVSLSIALGLGALLAIERDDRRGDLLACVLLTLSVFTYTVGLGYLVGVAVAVLLRKDRLRTAWIFLVPLLLYAVWWVWAQQFDQGRTDAGQLTQIVEFFARSMAVNAGGITGVNVPWLRIFDPNPVVEGSASPLGWLVGAALTGALVWRILKGSVPRSLWASLGVLVTFWLAAAIADTQPGGSQAAAIRYLLPGSTALLLVLVDAVRGYRIRAGWAYALLAVFAFSLAMNVVFLRDGASYLRAQGLTNRIELAMFELRSGLDPGADEPAATIPDPAPLPPGAALPDGAGAGYPVAVARFGSPALSIAEIGELPAAARSRADAALVADGGIAILPFAGTAAKRAGCERVEAGSGGLELPAGATAVRPVGDAPVAVSVSRFSEPPGVPLGDLPPGRWSLLTVASDRAAEPWSATFAPGARVAACPLEPTG